MSDEINKEFLKSASDFLQNDFNQCFEQARYYDGQIVDIFKFLAGFYTTVAGIAIGLYQYALDKNIDLSISLAIGLGVALIFGLCMFFLMVRNRVYFVYCMRYINEQRGLFLSTKPHGFENKTRFYTDYKQPPFFNSWSSQSWWLYVVSILNAALLCVLLYIIKVPVGWTITAFTGLIIFQLILGIQYLVSKENRSASNGVFGNKRKS
jgi:ABC-type branched-subunit amino acid transport system permease subunit